MHPSISLITPCYRSGPFLDRLHRSLTRQTYRNFEWICVDDHSPDDTVDLLLKMSSPGDLGMRVYRLPQNTYGPVAIAVGTQKAAGEIILWLDHDDEFLPDALAQIAAAWPRVRSRSDRVGLLFPVADQSKSAIAAAQLPIGTEVNYREFGVQAPHIGDSVWAIKREVAQKVATVERMEDVALLGVTLGEMADHGRFLVAGTEPIKLYHRDNPDSQTNNPRVSRKTVASYARLLNQADRNYIRQPRRWLGHTATMLRYSRQVHGRWLQPIDLVPRIWPRLAMIAALPLGWLAERLRPPVQVVDIPPLAASPEELAALPDLKKAATQTEDGDRVQVERKRR